ncbi:MAG: apolipoprotein N-acyltransferase [Pseudomonadales bacterium]|nr:apolipoprotein N-acyltransferase [Pseudomonadales bacterium]
MSSLIFSKVKEHPRYADFLALSAGLISPLALAPFNLWPVGLVAIVMLLVSLQATSIKRCMLRFYAYNVGSLATGASWLYVSIHEHGQASVVLALTLVVLFVLAVAIPMLGPAYIYLRFFRGGKWGVIVFAVFWVSKEWLYTWFLTGFPWLFVGYGHLQTPLAGYAPYLGVLGVSFFVVLSSGMIFQVFDGGLSRARRITGLAGLIAIWVLGWILGLSDQVRATGEPVKVSLVQGNIAQNTKWQPAMVWPIIQVYEDLSRPEWGRDIIVWPEAALTVSRRNAQPLLNRLDARARLNGSTLLLGIPDHDKSGRFLNSAIALGNGQGEYFKRHLVPFGEYMPLENLLRGLVDFFDLPMSHNQPGPWQQTGIVAGDLKLAISICYEVVFSNLVRSNQAVPDLLVTISNDTWFGRSIGPLQHMQMAQMRALENGRYLIRGTNNGVTAIVDYHGRILAQLAQFEPGVLRGEVFKMVGVTAYTRFGDVPILGLMLFLLGLRWVEVRRDTQTGKAGVQ